MSRVSNGEHSRKSVESYKPGLVQPIWHPLSSHIHTIKLKMSSRKAKVWKNIFFYFFCYELIDRHIYCISEVKLTGL